MDVSSWHLLDLTPSALLGMVVVLLLTGRLFPRKAVDDANRDRDYWRQAHTVSEQVRAEQKEQITELLEQSRLTVQLLQGIRDAADRKTS